MLDIRGQFTVSMVACPSTDEDNECVGRLRVCAYLHVTGTVQHLVQTPGSAFQYQSVVVDDKILHQFIEIPFRVDFPASGANSVFGEPQVKDCGNDFPSSTPSQKPYPDGQFVINFNAGSTPGTTRFRAGNCLEGVATFTWTAGIAGAGYATQPTASVPLLGNAAAVVTGTVAVAGSTQNVHTLNVRWRVCYDEEDDGRCVLTAQPDNREVGDACAVAP
jgi:hypothetical protein